ncbi:replication-associated recombination protein A [Patescibacteria group bacterium]|nr:replication-associated recombination protein A [Patescibacteria group bacterium]MBU4141655.1 replication-associated recombination protein A [Patescibacteria group bacterium]
MNLFGETKQEKKQPFKNNLKGFIPLAERMRPENFDDFLGQEEIVGEGKILRLAIEKDGAPSMIFWGPPGTGKTTLARIIAKMTKSAFIQLSATSGSVKDIREVVRNAEKSREFNGQKTILFVDEIHRFNKAQQDAFLPYVENGAIILIGATTENPSFEVNSALLSRCRVFIFKALRIPEIERILRRALGDKEKGLGNIKIKIAPQTIKFLAGMSGNDARTALNALELAAKFSPKDKNGAMEISGDAIKESLQKTHLLYDRDGEEHYNIISALHKSMRGSDVNAALYWLGRMLEAGEDPLFVARRLARFASEDIGLADPNALAQAVAAYQACHFIGMPECNVNLAQVVAYLARAPKSNELYAAYQRVQEDIKNLPAYPVPLHIRNAPTDLMKNIGYGKDYKYNPNFTEPVEQDYLPAELKNRKYFWGKMDEGKS